MALLVKWLDGYSFRVCRVWERLLAVEIVDIQPLSVRPPSVLATEMGLRGLNQKELNSFTGQLDV